MPFSIKDLQQFAARRAAQKAAGCDQPVANETTRNNPGVIVLDPTGDPYWVPEGHSWAESVDDKFLPETHWPTPEQIDAHYESLANEYR